MTRSMESAVPPGGSGDVLFEPVSIGPVTAPNRFYQVPHCTGMGYRRPRTVAEMRGVKAEGGWGVVSTEYTSFHPSSDDEPYPSHALWDDGDIDAMALMTSKVHAHGSLAAVELWHGGAASANHYSREVPIGPVSLPAGVYDPVQTRALDRDDITELRRWHRAAAARARRAGFDIVYVYACHWYLLSQFLDPSNVRRDEYGGPLENRMRLLRELIEDTKDEVGDTCAVAVRFSAGPARSLDDDDPVEVREEAHEILERLAELPDLWDITVDDYSVEMGSSRFARQGGLEPSVAWVKQVTTKPVVSVGRFTSPEMMRQMVRSGVVDLIGAARPSIADPFLPAKVREGRDDEIRECIGCNICYTGDQTATPIRCTQNPTMGEEYRKGWHPERIAPKVRPATVLVVGAGPAGLEAATWLGKRGYDVMLAEATRNLGGRVIREATLPGLAEWRRVADYRTEQLRKLPNVEVFLESDIDEEQIRAAGVDHVCLATGSHWRRDGVGRSRDTAIEGSELPGILTPDDIARGVDPEGEPVEVDGDTEVVVYDDDHYYLASVIAEKFARHGASVTYVTPANEVATWTRHTEEQFRTQSRLMRLGVAIRTGTTVGSFGGDHVELECGFTGDTTDIGAARLVLVTARIPDDGLWNTLPDHRNVTRIGDCLAPATIAAAVYAGHRYARELDADVAPVFLREHPRIRTVDGVERAVGTEPAIVASQGGTW